MTTKTETTPGAGATAMPGAEDQNANRLEGELTMSNAIAAPLTIETQIAGGGITVDSGHLGYDIEQQCVVIDFPGGDVILLPHEARNLADAIFDKVSTMDREEGPTIGDLLRCADILGFNPSELVGALAPLFLAKRDLQKAEAAK